jgi:branched-chain amino acid transport system substrate-binding protein
MTLTKEGVMKSKTRMSRALVCFLFLGILFCTFESQPATAQTGETIVKLGSDMAFSGGGAFWGIGYTNACKLAAKQINASGGFMVKGQRHKWEIVACDSKYVTSEAVSCANKLIYQDKVKYMISLGGAPSIAIAPITTKEKVLEVCWAGGGKELTNPNYPLVFRHSPVDVASAQTGLYKWLIEKRGVKMKTIATIHPDDESGYSAGEGCKEAAEANGVKVLATEYYPRKTTDFYPILSRIIAKKPDCIDTVFCGPGELALIAKQLGELKYNGVRILYTIDPVKSIQIAGAANLEGDYSFLTLAKMITPEQKKFYQDYVAEYGEWNEQGLLAYDFVFTLTECIVEGQTFDPVKIAGIMENKEIPYLYGKGRYGNEEKFGIKRSGLYPTPLCQFRNGEWHHVTFIEPTIKR